jgi:hypothetical protein
MAVSVMLLGACSEESSTRKSEFLLVDGSTIDLAEANLYLMRSESYENDQGAFKTRNYYLTDGTYVEGDPLNFSSYTGITFFLEIDLNVPDDEDFEPGNYPLRYDYSLTPADINFSYIYLQLENDDYYESYDNEDATPIKVTGGFDDGETMQISYTGTLKFYYNTGEGWVNETFDGEIFYKGVVSDERVL